MSTFDAGAEQYGPAERSMCALVQDLLPLYIEGEVSPQSRDMIVDHLGECAHCAGFLAGAQSIRAQLRRENTGRLHASASGEAGMGWVGDFVALLVGGLALAAVVAIGGIAGLELIRAPGEWLLLLFNLVEPRWMYALLSLATLAVAALLLVTRRSLAPVVTLGAGGAALGLGLVGFLISYPSSMEWLLRTLLVVSGATLLWHQRHEIRAVSQRDVARLIGVGCLVIGGLTVVVMLRSAAPLAFSVVNVVPARVDEFVPTAVPPEMYALEDRASGEFGQVLSAPTAPPPDMAPLAPYVGEGRVVEEERALIATPTPTPVPYTP